MEFIHVQANQKLAFINKIKYSCYYITAPSKSRMEVINVQTCISFWSKRFYQFAATSQLNDKSIFFKTFSLFHSSTTSNYHPASVMIIFLPFLLERKSNPTIKISNLVDLSFIATLTFSQQGFLFSAIRSVLSLQCRFFEPPPFL